MLQGRNITVAFGGLIALSNLDFEVRENEIVGLIGPNGAGKTTLFNAISGICKIKSGIILFKGERIDGISPYEITRKGIGRTFQIPRPFKSLSVVDNVVISILFGRQGKQDIIKTKKEALDYLDICDIERKYYYMSSGEVPLFVQRRLELARALAINPRIILVDEVLAGLNPKEVEEGIKLLKKIRDDLNITLFVVEHNMKAIMEISDRIIVLCAGQKICEGKPREVSRDLKVIKAYLGEEYVLGSH